ncbi:MAG: SDR family NAD(P)-dependent oxidoreductase, partial [Steroidobacteraceae bacterium]
MDLELSNKVAVVTGSSRGLGLASARALVEEGCRVTICARGADALDRAARELGERVLPVRADVTTVDGIDSVIAKTVET